MNNQKNLIQRIKNMEFAYQQEPFDMFYILLISILETSLVSFCISTIIEINLEKNLFWYIFPVIAYFVCRINKSHDTITELNKIIKENSDDIHELKKEIYDLKNK